jgi:plastocyanin
MTKKRSHQQNGRSVSSSMKMTITRKRIITYGIIAAIISGVGIAGFGIPINHFIKAKYSAGSGYAWVSMSSSSSKGLNSGGRGGGVTAAGVSPSYVFVKGGLQSMHVVNEDYETHSKHNFNIDEFNVHSKDLTYTQSQTITFVADKSGTFNYYCNIHPEMKGDIIVK